MMNLLPLSAKWIVAQSRQFSVCLGLSARMKPVNVALASLAQPKKNLDKKINLEIERLKKLETSSQKKKHPVLQYSDRTKAFNKSIMKTIGVVMSQIPPLVGHGISISNVNTTKDFSEIRVFWITSKEASVVEDLSFLLNDHAGDIRTRLNNSANLGAIPKISFHYDKQYVYENVLDKLIQVADKGPPEVNEENVEIKHVEDIEMGANFLGLDRSSILYNVEVSVKRSEASHRYTDQGQVEHFNNVYREAVAVTDDTKKKERIGQIKNFLRQRRKDDQRMRKEKSASDKMHHFDNSSFTDSSFNDMNHRNDYADEDDDDYDDEDWDDVNEK